MDNKTSLSFIGESDFGRLLSKLSSWGKVYVPYPSVNRDGNESYFYELFTPEKTFVYRGYRPAQPLKTFLFKDRIKVSEYPSDNNAIIKPANENIVIVGAAACDLISLRTLDSIFLDKSFTDIFYREMRENTFIISSDCSKPRTTCFCTKLGNNPYPEKGYDLNISSIDGGYLIEAGSERGREVMIQNSLLFSDAGENLLKNLDNKRVETTQIIERQNEEYSLSKSFPELLAIQRESDNWFEHVLTCVECGACIFSCPTCHCFQLYDREGLKDTFERIREWDACIYAGFSKMAGGSSPRLGLMERFRHRYLHKLEYFPKNYGFEACTGCGRCIEGCMGKIDMRKVLKALDINYTGATAKHE